MHGEELRPARREELPGIWAKMGASGVFPSLEALERSWSDAPWRIQTDDTREVAVLARWRKHLPFLVLKGLWCSPRRIGALLADIRSIAASQGYAWLLSPLLPELVARPYLEAGMREVERIVAYRLDRRRRVRADPPPGVTLRIGTGEDLERVLEVDALAFPRFWRYDSEILTQYLRTDRLEVADESGRVVGYTLCSMTDTGEGVVGRLAVRPSHRLRGIGSALLGEAVDYLMRSGSAWVSLCTQRDNEASRRLYSRAGFRQTGDDLLILAFTDLGEVSGEPRT